MTGTERDDLLRQLRVKRELCRGRRNRLWIWLGIQLVIAWILNPDFIPFLSGVMGAVNRFLGDLLWPRNVTEFYGNTYRSYIYNLCNWIKDLGIYPLLQFAVPRVLPVWLVVTYFQIWIVKARIRGLNKPPKEKKVRKPRKPKRKWKLPTFRLSFGPKVSGLQNECTREAERRFKQLQETCRTMQAEKGKPWEKDRGLWVSNLAKRGNITPPDRIYGWDARGVIEIKDKEDVLRFQLYADGARLHCHGGNPFVLTKGVPLSITHENNKGEVILDMTVTWLGGADL